jgi:chromosomal replication initiation ATPase DnaA
LNRDVLFVDGQAVIQAVCAVCDFDKEHLFKVRRGVANIPKDLAMDVLRAHSQKTLKEIGSVLACNRYSTVGTAMSRFESMMEGDVSVRRMYERICREMGISQP